MATTRIMLDPGHAGYYYNASPVVPGYYESRMTWSLAAKLKAALEEYGFEVGLTRYNIEDDPELTARGCSARGYDLFLSFHSNAATYEAADAPWLIHFAADNDTHLDEASKKVAQALGPIVSDVMGVSAPYYYTKMCDFDRNGDWKLNDEYYGVLYGAKCVGVPGVIIEHSFHTNKRATEWLLNEDNLTRLAEAEAEALAKYYGMEEKPMTVAERKEFESLKSEVANLKKTVDLYERQAVYTNAATIWNYIDSNLPTWATPTIKKLVTKKVLKGNEKGELELSYTMLRILVLLDRVGLFGE